MKIIRLKKALKNSELARDILKKTVGILSKETGIYRTIAEHKAIYPRREDAVIFWDQ